MIHRIDLSKSSKMIHLGTTLYLPYRLHCSIPQIYWFVITYCQFAMNVIKCKAAIAWRPNESISIEEIEVDPPKVSTQIVRIWLVLARRGTHKTVCYWYLSYWHVYAFWCRSGRRISSNSWPWRCWNCWINWFRRDKYQSGRLRYPSLYSRMS